jgi:hypothetical protein
MVIWRVNSKMTRHLSAGFVSPGRRMTKFGAMKGMNSYSSFVNKDYRHYTIIRHEFSHLLLGGNNFHTGGAGAGTKTFMSSAGGYSMLSSFDSSSPVYSAFDRRRLGWIHPGNRFPISARNPRNGEELNGDIAYGQTMKASGEFLLRDFVSYGDALRIELPYLRSESDKVKRQWLWLENHQMISGNTDHGIGAREGLYAYIQVGKEDMQGALTFGGECNYTWPLSAMGNYDLEIDEESMGITASYEGRNPFTGYNNLMRGAWDLKEKDGIIYRDELFTAKNLKLNGFYPDSSQFNYMTYPWLGTSMDAFLPGDRIGLDQNPAAVPVLTYRTSSSSRSRPRAPAASDNRAIHLNGISVEVLEQRANGDLRIRVRWDDRLLRQDVRWCGDIRLHEDLQVGKRVDLLLDRGLTPTRPIHPDTVGGQPVFSDPTVLVLKVGSSLNLDRKANLILRNASRLVLDAGSRIEMSRGSRIRVGDSCRITVHPDAIITGRGRIILEGSPGSDIPEGSLKVRLKSQN